MWNPFTALGALVLVTVWSLVHDGLAAGEVLSRTVTAAARSSRGALRSAWRTTVLQVYFTGVQSLPIAGLLAVLVGLGFARVITSTQLFVVVPVMTDLILQQIGPLLAALVVVTRSAPAVAVELGNMRVAGEVRMLESFGIDPFRHLAWPRVAGITLAVVALCFLVTGLALSALFLVVRHHPEFGGRDFWLDVKPGQALRIGFLGCLFGLSIALVSIHQGLSLRPLHTEVPKAASRAAVKNLVYCALLDVIVTVGV
jgi:phospholipid/cholesterol/gamma-HCH transport system permease protein